MIVDALKTPRSVWRKKDKLLCHNCSFECSLSSPSQLMSANLHQAARCNEWIWEVWRWKWISPTCTWWDVISRPSGGCCVPGKLLISQCFICTLIALFQFHDLLITICFQHLEPGVSKAHSYEGKGEDDISNRTELTGYFSPYPMKCQKQKIHIVSQSGDVCFMRDWLCFEGKNHIDI